MESWAAEMFTGESIEQGALMNAKALGGVYALQQILSLIDDLAKD